jgi:hypothetical protein
MDRDEIIARHYRAAQSERATWVGLLPLAGAAFLILMNSGVNRVNSGAGFLVLPCFLPILAWRRDWTGGIDWVLGGLGPALMALLITGQGDVMLGAAALGLAGVALFHLVIRFGPRANLDRKRFDQLNEELQNAGLQAARWNAEGRP